MNTPILQRTITFYGDDLIGVQAADGTIYTPFYRLCDNLGLSGRGQVQRVQRHAILSEALVSIMVETTGGLQEIQCLRIDVLPLWLAGLQVARIKPELQEHLVHYQKEAALVLWQAFKPQIIVEAPAEDLAVSSDEEITVSTDAEFTALQQIADMGRAIVHMAEEQMELRRRMDVAARVVQGIRHDIRDVKVRLEVLEERVSPGAYITDAQAAEVSMRVKALAEQLTVADKTKNHYQGVFAELYRRFGVTGYKSIPFAQYEDVLAFLEDWRQTYGGSADNTTAQPGV